MPKAVQFHEYGGPEQIRVEDVPPLVAAPGQVRIDVRSAAVNPFDWKVLAGYLAEVMPLELPAGLGSDVAGVVDQVGDGVTDLAVGDEVLGQALTDSFAASALAAPRRLVSRPPGIPWEVAGGLAGAGGTAWGALSRLAVSDGDTLLVHAAAGGVGIFAVQLAAARGARVIGTASEANHGFLSSLGAAPVLYGEGLSDRVIAIAPDGVDAVLDASGRGELPVSIELAGGTERVLTLADPTAAEHGVAHFQAETGDLRPALEEILALIASGHLEVPIHRTYPLEDAAAALAESQAGHLRGKIVLTME